MAALFGRHLSYWLTLVSWYGIIKHVKPRRSFMYQCFKIGSCLLQARLVWGRRQTAKSGWWPSCLLCWQTCWVPYSVSSRSLPSNLVSRTAGSPSHVSLQWCIVYCMLILHNKTLNTITAICCSHSAYVMVWYKVTIVVISTEYGTQNIPI